MTWTIPRTWVVGEAVTAGVMNTHVRDNLNARPLVQAGVVAISFTGATAGLAQVVFPQSYSTVPSVTAACSGSSGFFAYLPTAPTALDVTIGLRSYSSTAYTGAVNADWTAVGARGDTPT